MTLSDVEARVAGVITRGLREGLVHPGDPSKNQAEVGIPLPPFKTAGMPPEMTEHVETMANLMGEAIAHLIASEVALVDKDEYAKLTGTEHPPMPDGRVMVYCRCGNPLVRMSTKNNVATVDSVTFTSSLAGHTCRT